MSFLATELTGSHVDVFLADLRICKEYGLALEAAGIFYAIELRGNDYALVVAPADAERARAELRDYRDEQDAHEALVVPTHSRGRGWIGAVGYVLVLCVLTALQHHKVFSPDWLAAGRNEAELTRGGDLWRTVTALTLHADFAHLVSNLGFGSLIGLFVGQVMGSGLGWLSILLCGAAGNLLSAIARPPGYSSIGASTAVFAALGILAGHTWTNRRRLRASTLVKLAPIVGGVILLGQLGTGGERTDILSHVTGFVSGVILGGIYGKLSGRFACGPAVQVTFGVAAVALLALNWAFALA